ncbi:MAG: hypothetical protein H0W62_03715 [Chitinophagales bacterium]|nr:hypothetical protein [Chitinophagales bacterium]
MYHFRFKASKSDSLFTVVFLLSLLSPFISFRAIAQANIKSEEIDIVKPYQPLLADAQKINLEAAPAKVDTAIVPLNYSVNAHLIAVPFAPAEIRALSMPAPESETLLHNLLKAGFGTQFTPLIDLYLNNGRSDKYNFGFNFHHLSSNGKLDFQNFNSNAAAAKATTYFAGTSLGGKLTYDRDVYHFYGIKQGDSSSQLSKDFLKQRFQNIGVALQFQNTQSNKQLFDYHFDFDFHYLEKAAALSSIPASNENYFHFGTDLHKKILTIHSANVKFDFEKEKFRSTSDTDLNYFSVIPYYQLNHTKGKITAGINLTFFNNTFTPFPYLEGEYKLIGDYLIPYAGWKGGRMLNTIESIRHINPFIGAASVADSKFNAPFIGLKGSYGNNLSYNIKASYQTKTNDPFFLPDAGSPTTYRISYYYQSKVINVHAELGFRESEHINFLLSGDANSYDLDFNDQPWGIPKSQLSFSTEYNLQNKIFATISIFGHTGTYTIVPEPRDTLQLKGRFDANLSVTYNYKNNVGFWIALNNITSSTVDLYYNYPTYKFQAMAGVNLKF